MRSGTRGPWAFHDDRRRRADALGVPALFFDKGRWTWFPCNAIDSLERRQRNEAAKAWTKARDER